MFTGDIPQQFRIGAIVSLYKKDDKLDVNNYRGIMLLSILGKIFNYVLNKRITRYCVTEKILSESQNGFLPFRGTIQHIFALQEMITQMLNTGETPYLFFLDLSKAFDTINREELFSRIRKTASHPKCSES